MAYAVTSRANTAADALRDLLGRAERLVVNLTAQNVEEFLTLLDDIDAKFDDMNSAEDSMDLRPEQARWESILRRLSSRPTPLARAADAAGGLKTLRERHPPADSFWWHLDREVVRRRMAALRKFLVTVTAVLVIVVGGIWLVNRFFPPDADAVFLMNAQSDIDRAVMEGDYQAALQLATDARQTLPDSVELAILEAVLTERTGDVERANALIEKAKSLLDDEESFWILTGNTRFQALDIAGAEVAARTALELNPESAQAHFLLGNIAEATGDRMAAIDMFERTSELAGEDNPQLSVIAKVRMGQLLQSPNLIPAETPAVSADAEPPAEPNQTP